MDFLRERKQIQRVRASCQQEINQLKRQLSNRATFDEVTAKKSIARLQRQLDDARRQVVNGAKNTAGKTPASPIGVELIDNTLQIITSMQQRRKDLESEISALKERCERTETANRGMEYEKAKYMEGAVWFGRRVTGEVERLCQTIDILTRELQQREQHERAIESTTSFGGSPRVKVQIAH